MPDMTWDEEKISEQERVCKGATPAPWLQRKRVSRSRAELQPGDQVVLNGPNVVIVSRTDGGVYPAGDENFTVAARSNYPSALRALREALKVVKAAEKLIGHDGTLIEELREKHMPWSSKRAEELRSALAAFRSVK